MNKILKTSYSCLSTVKHVLYTQKICYGTSFLNCYNLLSSDQILLKEQVKKFSDIEIKPLANFCDQNDSFPHELWPKLGNFGILGPTAPTEFGGLGLSYLDHIIILEEISRASGSIALSYGAHSNLCVNQLVRWGNQEQKERFLPKLLDGSFLGALAMSEVESGSDVVSLSTNAFKDGDYYIINGSKMWITNGPSADIIIVYTKTNPDAGSKGITAFIVEKGIEGFSVGKKLNKLGMRGSETGELIFNNCRVHKSNILGDLNNGVKVLMSGLDSERLILSAGPIGIMQACFDLVVPYVNTRKQFNTYISDFQLIQGKLADMYSTLIAQRALLYSVAAAYSSNKANRMDCASVILSCSEKATWCALQAIQLLGGNGYVNDFPAGRFLRDAKLYEIGAGTSEIRRMLIGKEINRLYRNTL